ncbi:hypothetical protein OR60_16655 [Xanthomonas vesicatoria]|uniref:Uncharacterized protein n=1 Tax=Xanthomonas vesicatoria TaxID=56460 RepID=A0AAJ0N3Q5_9XANT|nr:hypothetical protein BI313_13415 [Xanthomonas vesicatoria]KHM92421.1 hypothetical protein OR60_16655 [Xanthomonas vesicatoria]KHM93196.1 hypothetical protein OR61_14740 [Xanthomonas vesicatoria]
MNTTMAARNGCGWQHCDMPLHLRRMAKSASSISSDVVGGGDRHASTAQRSTLAATAPPHDTADVNG